jgi:hypothetical protein
MQAGKQDNRRGGNRLSLKVSAGCFGQLLVIDGEQVVRCHAGGQCQPRPVWGTHIEMNCTCGEWPQNSGDDDIQPGDKLAMVMVGRDGSHSQPWSPSPPSTASTGPR